MNPSAYKNNAAEQNDYAQTPWWVIHQLVAVTGYAIAWDVCCLRDTAKARLAFNHEDHDALKIDWFIEMQQPRRRGSMPINWAAYMNPPFSEAETWTKKASTEAAKGLVIIGCVKDAPDTNWYQQHVEQQATAIYKPTGRLQFIKPDGTPFTRTDPKTGKQVRSGANFPVCFPVWTSLRLNQPAPIVRFKFDKARYQLDQVKEQAA